MKPERDLLPVQIIFLDAFHGDGYGTHARLPGNLYMEQLLQHISVKRQRAVFFPCLIGKAELTCNICPHILKLFLGKPVQCASGAQHKLKRKIRFLHIIPARSGAPCYRRIIP